MHALFFFHPVVKQYCHGSLHFPFLPSVKQLIERIIDFSRRQITDCMAASNPTFRAIHKPADNVVNDGNAKEHAEISFYCFSNMQESCSIAI